MKRLSLASLQRIVPLWIFERGYDYWERGLVLDLKQTGVRLVATVLGQGGSYQTTLNVDAPHESSCSCPYQGTCKHVIAVGLAWLKQPASQSSQATDASGESEGTSLYQQIEALDRYDLLDLTKELLDCVPDTYGVIQDFLIRRWIDSQ